MGKHLYEFKRKEEDDVPEIFILLIKFFDDNPELLKTEGLFRLAGDIEKIEELSIHMSMGNYFFLTKLNNAPHVVACYLKKILRQMGEPLCTFKLYS